MEFQDHFSKQADLYVLYRPDYPPELFEYLAALAPARECAWDCGTGNGQAAWGLAPHFERVIATDASRRQIEHARAIPNVEYRVAAAERSGLEDASCDMITVAQALHWFSFDDFYAEAHRALKSGGIFAAWTYKIPRFDNPRFDAVFREFYQSLESYWPSGRRFIEESYRTIPFPFEELKVSRQFFSARAWTFEDFCNFIETWSALREYRERHAQSPMDEWRKPLLNAWGASEAVGRPLWTLIVRVGIKRD